MARRRKPQAIPNISIIDIAHKGKSIGKDEEGNVYMIDGTVPGDIINGTYYRKRKGLRVASIDSYVQKSEHRVEAKCDHFGVCGGCKWQHFNYEAQLQYKEKDVRQVIQRLAHDSEDKVEAIVGSKKIFDYRNKMEYSFSNNRWITEEEAESGEEITNKNALGFHRPGNFYKVVDIHRCHLQHPKADAIRNAIREYANEHNLSYFDYHNHNGFLRDIIIRNTTLDHWMLIFVFYENRAQEIEKILGFLKDSFPYISSLYFVINQKANDTIFDLDLQHYSGSDCIEEKLGEVTFKIGPKSFFQTNSLQAKVLYDIAVEFAEFTGDELVYDLYTGLGSIALFVANFCKHVVGIEEIEQAIEDAKVNREYNDITNATFYAGDVRNILTEEFADEHGKPDIVITDPPRSGMHKDVVETLLLLESPKIVYISCNPGTLARDIDLLKAKYELIKIRPVDMFPHTHHVECVSLLKLK